MTNPIRMIFNHRLLALIGKEFTQIRRDSRLMVTMTIQPPFSCYCWVLPLAPR